jgi:multiple sugar transport system substrate-binding protein
MFDAAGLKAPPVSWDDTSWTVDKMLEYSLKLAKNVGKPDATYGVNATLWAPMTSYAYLFGGDAWLPEHYTNTIAPKTNLNTDAVIEGHQWVQDLTWKHKVMPDPGTQQAMQALQDPFKTGKIGMALDGGWLFWTLSDIKDFKLGYAALPMAKTNKHINFDDFWIMGRSSPNKDGAWQVMRALTSVDATTKYSVQSGTPPTPRDATDPWAKKVADRVGEPLEKVKTLLSTSIEKGRIQESPDHLFLQYPKISTTYDNESAALWNHADATADKVIPAIAKVMDQTVLDIYNQFKDSMPKE